jgi:RNA polymerase primary sigma factor
MQQFRIINVFTNREEPTIQKYLREIGRIAILSPEDEGRLAALAMKGDKPARDLLIKANLRFVVSVAKQYQGHGLSFADLINEGNMGLIKAAGHFDETRGFKFISYAIWWIRQYIIQAIAEKSRLVRIPANKRVLSRRVEKTRSKLEQELERPVAAEELAEAMELETAIIESSLLQHNDKISLDSPLSEEGEDTLLDILENPGAIHADKRIDYTVSLGKEIDRSLKALTKQQKEIICFFFGIGYAYPMSADQIGERLHLSRERVRQIKGKAIEKIRKGGNIRALREYIAA